MIGADGAGSVVRRVLGHDRNPDGHLALAIRGYAPAPAGPPEQRIVTAADRWPAYAWTFPIGDGRANVGYGEVLLGQLRSAGRTWSTGSPPCCPTWTRPVVTDLRAHLLPLSTRRPPPGPRAAPAGRRRAVADQPVHRRGHLLRRPVGFPRRRGGGAGRPRGRAAHRGPAVRRGARPATAPAPAAQRRRRGARPAALRWWTRPCGPRAGDQRVFDTMVELGLGDGRLDAGTLARIARATVRR